MIKYNGHQSYNHWNVALWFANDEGLYHLAKACRNGQELFDQCKEVGFRDTPDGVQLTPRLCGHALRCLKG